MDYTNITSDNILHAKNYDRFVSPQSYYNLRFGLCEVSIIRDKVFVNKKRSRRSKDFYYHILCSGFSVPWHDDNYVETDRLNKFKRIRYGNFKDLLDALLDFKKVCCSAFGGFYQISICSHFDDNKCLCDFSLFGAS